MLRCVKSTLEERDEKPLIECVEETVLAPFVLCPFQFMLQVIHIAVEESFFLNEIAEHQPVEHHRGIPLFVAVLLVVNLVVDARDELGEMGVFFLESGIEILGELLGVDEECLLHTRDDIGNGGLFVEVE